MNEKEWRKGEDDLPNLYYFIDHLNVQKRFRVLEGQFMTDLLEALAPNNYLTEFVRFNKACDNLGKCYPNMEELGYVNDIRIDFWARYKFIVKTKIKPMIRIIYKRVIHDDLKRMKMYGEV